MQNSEELPQNSKTISYLSICNSIDICLAVIDEKQELHWTNAAFNSYFNIKNTPKNLLEIFSNQELNKIYATCDHALKSTKTCESEVLFLNHEKEEIKLKIRVQCEDGSQEKLVTIVFQEVSKSPLNKQLQIYEDSLNKMNIELDQFVYKTAHDLRAPLTNLLGLISIMRNENDPNLLATYFDLQEKSVLKMDDFIQKITTYTKNTRLPISVQKIKIKTLIDNVLDELMYYDRSEVVKKNVHIDEEIIFYSDPERLEIILKNLIANAIKFSKLNSANSEVNISAIVTDVGCDIVIEDNGIGIPNSIQHKVFDMFYRGHASADGSGIGLYIVKETVTKLRGSIELHSEENNYTKITLHLPSISAQ